jgi:hypothetical protein
LSVNEDSLVSTPVHTPIQQLGSVPGFYLKAGSVPRRVSAYEFSVIALFACTVILSVTDLLTTSIALNSGLREGNMMLLGVASFFRLTFFEAIAATKLGFISGTALLAFLGIRSDIHATRKIVFSSLAAFVILLLFVSLNNLVMINL